MRDILGLIPKPSQYAGAEWNAVRKDLGAVDVRVALAFPDLYEVGMSYLGQKILYGLVNEEPGFYAERVFAPSVEAASVMREKGEKLATLETDTPLSELDAVGFHLTHELCYTNILYMLDLAGLPLRAADRAGYPLIMAGGGCVGDAEPVADFFDLMVLGDGEEVLPAILAQIRRAKAEGLSKQDLLFRLKDLSGVYVPSLFTPDPAGPGVVPVYPRYDRVDKAVVADLDAAYFPLAQISPCGKAVHDRLTLEIARGCTRGCRFCQAGMIYRPVRERSLTRIEGMLAAGLDNGGFEEVSLLSLSTGDFSALTSLFTAIVPRCGADQVAVSLPSLRAGTLSPGIMRQIAGIRRTGATMAPEAGSQRLRDVINKGVDEDEILSHAARLFGSGWQQVKLYFMIGLPTETEEDVRAIADLALKVLAKGAGAPRLQVTVAVSPFAPKPHTPFQWERQISLDEIHEKLDLLRSLLRPHHKIKCIHHVPEMSFLEGVFARGDRRLAAAVENAYRRGALFCSWSDHLRLEPWLAALAEEGLSPGEYLAGRDPDGPLPWDHLGVGVTKEYLLDERRKAFEGALTPDCRYHGCRACGVCGGFGFTAALPHGAKDVRPRLNREVPEWLDRDGSDGEDGARPVPAKAAPPEQGRLQHKAVRLRVWYAKQGPAIFLSQLELALIFERALRRARVMPSFSGGFHPLPLLSFGWALPVGVASLAEWFGIFLREPLTPEAFCRAVGPNLPAGLSITGALAMPLTGKMEHPWGEDFLLAASGGLTPDALWAAWREFLAAEQWPWSHTTKSGLKNDDVRRLALRAERLETGEIALRLDWREKYLNPLKLAAAISRAAPQEIRLTKTGQLFGESGESAGESAGEAFFY
ncbi:MAG: TIGR03960 family B12-binding radical SAM protein [Desulfovibrionaceae bacterium]|nr:TIGR03960 family B12-binding radical SAM protein [Desulfovibrionaceae bacterium]MBF0514207.1 TIGR03960 family B12-binding radical SAM protein [Desulfovibrionaceae bacterium]